MHKDVLSLPALMAEIWDSEIMHPVSILLEEVADYKSYVHSFLKPLEGHSKPLGFRFSMVNNVHVYRYQRKIDGPWIPEAGISLWKKVDGRYTVPDGEPLALKLSSSHPRLGEISPFISNLTDFLRTTYRDTTSEGYRKYSPVISYWKKVQENITSIQALEDETLQNGFWPQTNQGTWYKPTGLPQDATQNGRDDTVVVLDELERELQDENNLMLEPYAGDPADRPKRAFIPLEDITEGKFVVLRPDDDFEKEVPRVVWLGRAIGTVVRETSDERHGQFLIEWWRPRHRKSTNATNQERFSSTHYGFGKGGRGPKKKEGGVNKVKPGIQRHGAKENRPREYNSLRVSQVPEKRQALVIMDRNGCRLADNIDCFIDLEDDNQRERKLRDEASLTGTRFTRMAKRRRRIDCARLDRTYLMHGGNWADHVRRVEHYNTRVISDHMLVTTDIQLQPEDRRRKVEGYYKMSHFDLKDPAVTQRVLEARSNEPAVVKDGRRRWAHRWIRVKRVLQDVRREKEEARRREGDLEKEIAWRKENL
ncbi:hypothetical protein R1sor_008940 [Riccia sorocarpa]|uniref:Uncharacterized protein n=1 Tax=Riccia sorocarpa TaxID=122646 RepID=A0ABD3H8C9_9MARC